MSDEPTAIEDCDCPDPGVPAYMGTFADLMSLMLCFFVLLLSFAEMDALKFRMVVKSMDDAFGVDRPEDPETIPLATSIIQQTFSPSPNQPTPFFDQIRQSTVSETAALQIDNLKQYQMAVRNTQRQELNQLLKEEINLNLISVETIEDRITIRINEKASFSSGKAHLKASFIPILAKIRHSLAQTQSNFIVSGHTDNVPVNSSLYRSNWELSAARATSVVHVLLGNNELQAGRFRIEGYGSTKPLVANNSTINRAVNRRVEISLLN
jgi:chemotaxis protein MotB